MNVFMPFYHSSELKEMSNNKLLDEFEMISRELFNGDYQPSDSCKVAYKQIRKEINKRIKKD